MNVSPQAWLAIAELPLSYSDGFLLQLRYKGCSILDRP
jgi:hypothetical protein